MFLILFVAPCLIGVISFVHFFPDPPVGLPWSTYTDTIVLVLLVVIQSVLMEIVDKRWAAPRTARRLTRQAFELLTCVEAGSSYVYLIGPIHGMGPYKVGMSKDVRRRLTAMQTGSPEKLRLYWYAPGGYELEQRLHRALAPWRVHGEWFDLGEEPEKFIWRVSDHCGGWS